jgi:hypothetical protein
MNNEGWLPNDDGADGGDRAAVRVKDDHGPFKDLAGRTHPRTQGRRMGLGRVVGMVSGVGHRLRIGQPAQKQEADRHADGNGPECASREHRGEY